MSPLSGVRVFGKLLVWGRDEQLSEAYHTAGNIWQPVGAPRTAAVGGINSPDKKVLAANDKENIYADIAENIYADIAAAERVESFIKQNYRDYCDRT
jgi:hypothetical protein